MTLKGIFGRKLISEKGEIYTKLRELVSPKISLELPEHEVTNKLLINMFPQDEAFLVINGFKKTIRPTSARKIRKRTQLSKTLVKSLLNKMVYAGKLIKYGPFYIMLPYIPGGFEFYFTTGRDDPERMKKVAEAHDELFNLGYPLGLSKMKPPIYRVISTIQPTNDTIEINKSVDVEHQVLPYEVLKEYLAEKKDFAVVACSCRTAAEMAGHPCERTAENFCITAGILARYSIKTGVGREVTLEELMDVMQRAEKEGLVHQTINIKKNSGFICNCCPCCCGFLKSVKKLDNYGAIIKSNFDPSIDQQKCVSCSICQEICPMDAILKTNGAQQDSKEQKIKINKDLCIGCGLCASHCPHGAISLDKVRGYEPIKGLLKYLRKVEKEN
ncbi:MAG: 4Fe-4S ferredoxin iron-sulfur binding domain-containing protein [Promethearchaeota archaeon]|nr:MAG: 4Fe-4S ferredoxin iron-sulfur binding domain-containing protein [Candidatus Lokiarchaeota archaeon]